MYVYLFNVIDTPKNDVKPDMESKPAIKADTDSMDVSPSDTAHMLSNDRTDKAESQKNMSPHQPLCLQSEENRLHPQESPTSSRNLCDPQTFSHVPENSCKSPCKVKCTDDAYVQLDEHFDLNRGHDHISTKKEDPLILENLDVQDMEATPNSETSTEMSSPLGLKLLKSPTGMDSPATSVDTSKTSVSSSPAVSIDFHSSNELFQSQTPAHSFSTANAFSTTFISVTPKIGMGKPAITKRKFSPGRPRSRQVYFFSFYSLYSTDQYPAT